MILDVASHGSPSYQDAIADANRSSESGPADYRPADALSDVDGPRRWLSRGPFSRASSFAVVDTGWARGGLVESGVRARQARMVRTRFGTDQPTGIRLVHRVVSGEGERLTGDADHRINGQELTGGRVVVAVFFTRRSGTASEASAEEVQQSRLGAGGPFVTMIQVVEDRNRWVLAQDHVKVSMLTLT